MQIKLKKVAGTLAVLTIAVLSQYTTAQITSLDGSTWSSMSNAGSSDIGIDSILSGTVDIVVNGTERYLRLHDAVLQLNSISTITKQDHYTEIWRVMAVPTGEPLLNHSWGNFFGQILTVPAKRIRCYTVNNSWATGLHFNISPGAGMIGDEKLAGQTALSFIPNVALGEILELAVHLYKHPTDGYFEVKINGRTIYWDAYNTTQNSPNWNWHFSPPPLPGIEWRVYPAIEAWSDMSWPQRPQFERDAGQEVQHHFSTALLNGRGDFSWSANAGGVLSNQVYHFSNTFSPMRHVATLQGEAGSNAQRTATTAYNIGSLDFVNGWCSIVLGDAHVEGAGDISLIVRNASDTTSLFHITLRGNDNTVVDQNSGATLFQINPSTRNIITLTLAEDGRAAAWALDMTNSLNLQVMWSAMLPSGWTPQPLGPLRVNMIVNAALPENLSEFSFLSVASPVTLSGLDSLLEAPLTSVSPTLRRSVNLSTMFGKSDEVANIPGGWFPERKYGFSKMLVIPAGRSGTKSVDTVHHIVPGLMNAFGLRFIKMTMSINDIAGNRSASQITSDTQAILEAFLANENDVWVGTDLRRELDLTDGTVQPNFISTTQIPTNLGMGDGYYNNYRIQWTTGLLAGIDRRILSYQQANGIITVSILPISPNVGDAFQISPYSANQNQIIDTVNQTTREFALSLQQNNRVHLADIARAVDEDPLRFSGGHTDFFAPSATGIQAVTHPDAEGYTLWQTLFAEILMVPADCNTNGIEDQDDIALGNSVDSNQNHIPDECESLPCVADITPPGGNNTVNIDDLVLLINSYGDCPPSPTPCPADIAPPGGDGTVYIQDLVAIINAFGPCP